jgi:hypothetical protein
LVDLENGGRFCRATRCGPFRGGLFHSPFGSGPLGVKSLGLGSLCGLVLGRCSPIRLVFRLGAIRDGWIGRRFVFGRTLGLGTFTFSTLRCSSCDGGLFRGGALVRDLFRRSTLSGSTVVCRLRCWLLVRRRLRTGRGPNISNCWRSR